MDDQLTNRLNAVRRFEIGAQDIPAALLQFGEQAELTPEPQTPKAPLLKRLGAAIATTILAASGAAAAAADEATDEDEPFIEEIVVTAEKREENILKVPLTVSAFTDELIEELGITNELDIEQLVPGLQFGDDTEKVGHGTVIRGIGSRLWGESHTDLAVATYVDGVYTHATASIAPNLFDVERVEVARGPQGTLNGRNSIAGAISYVTKKPGSDWDVDLLTEFTDQVTQRYNAAVGGPIVGPLSFRLTAGRYTGDGAQKNIGLGEDYDAPDEFTVAPQLHFRSDRWDINLRYARTEDTGNPATNILLWDPPRDQPFNCSSGAFGPYGGLSVDAFANVSEPGDGFFGSIPYNCTGTPEAPQNIWYLHTTPNPAVPGCGSRDANRCSDLENKVAFNRPGIQDTTREDWTLNAEFNLRDTLSLRYTYGDSDIDQWTSRDGDLTNRVPSASNPFLSADGMVPFADYRSASPYINTQSSHELQIISNFGGRFEFIAGYYFYENHTDWSVQGEDFAYDLQNADADEQAQLLGYADCADLLVQEADTLAATGFVMSCPTGRNHVETTRFRTLANAETEAVFASMDLRFNEAWAFSGGLRWTEDAKWRDLDFIYTARQTFMETVPLIGTISQAKAVTRDSEAGGILASDQRPSWDAIIWNVALEHTPNPDRLLYGRISTGYRAGGFNSASSYNPEIEEETLINYEVGAKGLFMDQRLRLTSAAFYQAYDGYQINHISRNPDPETAESEPLVEYTGNIDDTSVWGAEVEASYFINEKWRISGFYTFLDSEIGPFESVVFGDPNPTFFEATQLDWVTGLPTTVYYPEPKVHTGGRLPMQPKHKYAVTMSYDTSWADRGAVQLLGTWSWSGEKYPYVQNVESQKIPDYGRLDLRATWTSPDTQWTVTGYVQNAFDKIGLVEYSPISTNNGLPMGSLTEPRQLGVQVRWRPALNL